LRPNSSRRYWATTRRRSQRTSETFSSDDRPYRRDSEAMAKFIVDCAAEVRCRHEDRYACKDQETLAWTKHYSAAYGLLGP
jgi:hypothetical protein